MGIAEFWRSMAIEIPCRSLGRLKSGVAVMPSTCSARLATSPCPRAQAVVEFRQKCCFRDSIATSQLVMGSQGVLARMCARWHHSRRRHSHQARRRHHSRRRHSRRHHSRHHSRRHQHSRNGHLSYPPGLLFGTLSSETPLTRSASPMISWPSLYLSMTRL